MPSSHDEGRIASPVEDAIRKLEIARQLRDLARHPAAVALAVQRVTAVINGLIWTGIVLGIAFSTANVQRFAAAGAPAFTLQWLAAWLFEPFVNLVLIAILLGQQICARHHITMDATWPTATKWVCFGATFAMNTWTYWKPFDLAGVVLHAIPPAIVLCAAETAPALNAALARAADAAEQAARRQTAHSSKPATAHSDDVSSDTGTTDDPPSGTTDTVAVPPAPAAPARSTTRQSTRRRRRRTRQEIIDEAVSKWRPGITVDRQWVLRVSGCSEGIATEVAEAVRATIRRQRTQAESGAEQTAEPARSPVEPTQVTTELATHRHAPVRT